MDVVALTLIVLLLCLFLKVPVFISILAGCVTYFAMNPNVATLIIAQRVVAGTESIPLLAVPFFVAAGVYMNYSGVTSRIMDFCSVITGRMTGGLAQVNVLTFIGMGTVVTVVYNMAFCLFFRRTEEFGYLWALVKGKLPGRGAGR